MATLEQIAEALKRADAAGHADDARALAAAYRQMQAQQQPGGQGEWVTPGQGEKTALSWVPGADMVSDFTRSLYPFQKNTTTGEMRPALPSIIPQMAQGALDAATLPGDVAAGRVDPMSDTGMARSLGFATMFGTGGAKRAMPPISAAAKNVGRALKDDGIPALGVPQALKDLGPGAMVMDLGPNAQAQAGALAALPGKAQALVRGAVENRAKGAGGRVANDIAGTIGVGPDIDTLKQQIVQQQSAAAKPLYDAVRGKTLPVAGNFQFVLQTPMGQQAFRMASRLAANDGMAVDGLTVGLVDYAKRALDDMAASAARSGNNNVARQAKGMADLLKRETDKAVPGYGEARKAFAGPAAVLDAIDGGYAAFSKDVTPQQMDRMLTAMTPSERTAYIQGAQSWLESQIGNAVNDAASLRGVFRKGWNETKLRSLLGNDVADAMLKAIDRELTYGKTSNVVAGNSETMRRAMAMGETAPQQSKVHPEGVIGLVARGFNAARSKIQGVTQPKVNEGMAKGLSFDLPSLDPTFISEVDRAMKPQPFAPWLAKDAARTRVLSQTPSVEDRLAAYGFLPGLRT